MSKSSSSKLILLQYLHHHPSKPSISPTPISQILTNHPNQTPRIPSISKLFHNPYLKIPFKPNLSQNFDGFRCISTWGSNLGNKVVNLSMNKQNPRIPSISKLFHNPHLKIPFKPNLSQNFDGFRCISTWGSNLGNKVVNLSLIKGRIKEPVKGVLEVVSGYKDVVGLQLDAFLRRNGLVLLGGGGVFVCVLLWKIMFGIADTFVGVSEGMAKYGFLALSSAIVAFAGLFIRSRFTINPDKVYRMSMRKLNTSAGILEIMGAPLAGTDLRAYVMSGGGLTLKNCKAELRSKRCFLIFPIRGAEMKGLVSVEVKNKTGQYDMKLLSVDIPMATGPDQRLFLIGDEEEYRVGGGLISELRDPVVKAMSADKEFEERDIQEDKEDAQRELEDAERKHREQVEKIQRGDS